jgi:copper resistance protein B
MSRLSRCSVLAAVMLLANSPAAFAQSMDMAGMDMRDNAPLAMLLVDQLESTRGRQADGQAWELHAWYGNDNDKLWLRSEGERSDGRVEDGQLELAWAHSATAFWDTQLGLRQDLGEGTLRQWAAFGVRGTAPYWVEIEATAYVGADGRTAARLRAEYELRLTRRLVLQPGIELNLYGRNDPAARVGRGLADTDAGLRLRYEISRQLAPYIGVVWYSEHGTTARLARQQEWPGSDRQFVAGVRFWF